MKKIYSFVLMAAMLLVGTNAWAAYQVGGTNYGTLQAALDAAGDGDEIVVTPTGSGLAISTQVVLNVDKHVILNLGDNAISFSGTPDGKAAFVVSRGVLEITGNGGQISSNVEGIYDLISVRGTSELIDAKLKAPYSQVIVRSGVTIKNEKYNAITVTENADKLANGARVDVYGNVQGQKYGIKVNGNVRDPKELGYPEANRQYTPYIYIDGNVSTIDNSPNAVAAYSSGYARWRIEGNCTGATGLYAKSGDVEIVGATIASNADYNTSMQTGLGSGVSAGGSAIVIESNSNYSGNVQVTIAESTVHSDHGFAIQETVASSETKVENITIVSGTIEGGEKGAIIVSQKTVNDPDADVKILGGNITSESNSQPIQINLDDTNANNDEDLDEDAEIIAALIPTGFQGATSAPTVQDTEVDGQKIVQITFNAGYLVTLNNEGLATFSANEITIIPEGLKVYCAGNLTGDVLDVNGIVTEEKHKIPAETGVILYGQPAKSYTLVKTADANNVPSISSNSLQPSTEWRNRSTSVDVYILHGNELWIYDGTVFPENKAFLQFLTAPAPARIRMEFHEAEEAQGIENVEVEVVKAEKFYENGQLYIRRGAEVYNVQGQLVK